MYTKGHTLILRPLSVDIHQIIWSSYSGYRDVPMCERHNIHQIWWKCNIELICFGMCVCARACEQTEWGGGYHLLLFYSKLVIHTRLFVKKINLKMVYNICPEMSPSDSTKVSKYWMINPRAPCSYFYKSYIDTSHPRKRCLLRE